MRFYFGEKLMTHRFGYACINLSIDATTNKTCRLQYCTDARLRELTYNNLDGLKKVVKWNIENDIYLYRISSAVVPYASHEINKIKWWEENLAQLKEISRLVKSSLMRVSMHPPHFVNINSPNLEIIKSSMAELEWHAKLLNTMELDNTHRLIFHVGGVYGDKKASIKRFIEVYKDIPEDIRKRLSLENDDKSYHVWDVLDISSETGVPVVFDVLHHQILNTGRKVDDDIDSILKNCFSTWNDKTGIPKIHYSNQKKDAKPGSHSDSIDIDEFMEFYFRYCKYEFDIMFEVKDKEKSVLSAYKRLKQELARGYNLKRAC